MSIQSLQDLPVLDKSALYELLSARFGSQDKRLSQIPDPAMLHDAAKAAKKIVQAIKEGKRITLVGDYDVDGISSTAIVTEFFKKIPYPLQTIIPNRFSDGYGVNPNVLKRIDSDLVITVDNGITALEAAEICKQRGIELIITDHHTPSDTLPDAYAIVNPKLSECSYPFGDICGAQVAWLLLGLVKKELDLNINMKEFLDILCIAVIADIMPLVDINRTIVKEGLKIIESSHRPCCVVIRNFLNKNHISSEDIGFQIAPRINSAGRLEDASTALAFLTADSIEKASRAFNELNGLNELRRQEEARTTDEAIELADNTDSFIVVAKEGWHEGVVGIVASRLVDHFEKPAIVLSIKDGTAKGSARSLGDVNIFELIKKNSDLLEKFGGHKMAAGLSLSSQHIDKFKERINIETSKVDKEKFLPVEGIMGMLPASEIDLELLDLLENFEPYGEANSRPLFLIREAHIVDIKYFGKDSSHTKVTVRQSEYEKQTVELILFKKLLEMPTEKKLTCSYRVTKNEFNNRVSAQLIINKIYNY